MRQQESSSRQGEIRRRQDASQIRVNMVDPEMAENDGANAEGCCGVKSNRPGIAERRPNSRAPSEPRQGRAPRRKHEVKRFNAMVPRSFDDKFLTIAGPDVRKDRIKRLQFERGDKSSRPNVNFDRDLSIPAASSEELDSFDNS